MSAGGPCYLCGVNPARGFASTWTAKDGERWYCHGDQDAETSCYERQMASVAMESLDGFLDEILTGFDR